MRCSRSYLDCAAVQTANRDCSHGGDRRQAWSTKRYCTYLTEHIVAHGAYSYRSQHNTAAVSIFQLLLTLVGPRGIAVEHSDQTIWQVS